MSNSLESKSNIDRLELKPATTIQEFAAFLSFHFVVNQSCFAHRLWLESYGTPEEEIEASVARYREQLLKDAPKL